MQQQRMPMIGRILAAVLIAGGAAAGTIAAADKAPESESVAKPRTNYDVEKAPWPCLRGPYHNGMAPSTGLKFIDDAAAARLVWRSDQPIPGNHPVREGDYWTGGYSGPIVAEGRVYLTYWVPAGRTNYNFRSGERGRNRNPVGDDRSADDVVHCFEAATGKTIWKQVFSGLGHANGSSKDGARHLTPCWWDGRIVAAGSAGLIYCLDAATGEELWRGEHQQLFAKYQQAKKTGPAIHAGCVGVADGVAAFGAGSGGRAGNAPMNGFDVETGERLWTGVPSAGASSPATWISGEGKEYFLIGNALAEPRSGKVLWKIPEIHCPVKQTVVGDFLVAQKYGEGKGVSTGPACYRISAAGFERLWAAEHAFFGAGSGYNNRTSAMVWDGHVYRPTGDRNAKKTTMNVYELVTGRLVAEHSFDRSANRGALTLAYGPLVAEGRLFACPTALHMYSLAPGGTKHLGCFPVQSTDTYPAYAGGFLYIRSSALPRKGGDGRAAHLLCYDLRVP